MMAGRINNRSSGSCVLAGRVPTVWITLVAMVLVLTTCKIRDTDAAMRRFGKPQFRSSTEYACEGEKLVLTCDRAEVIRITRANYGRLSLKLCNRNGKTDGMKVDCLNLESKKTISERCDGRQRCEMDVNNDIFEDSCPSTSKYAEVKYICQPAPQNPTRDNSTTPSHVKQDPEAPRLNINGAPEAPLITHVRALSPTEIEIKWTQARSESPILTTRVFYLERGTYQDPSTQMSTSGRSYTLRDLQPDTSYDIFLKSFNQRGRSLASNHVRVSTPPIIKTTTTTTTTTTEPPPLPETEKQPAASATSTTTTTTITTSTTRKENGNKPVSSKPVTYDEEEVDDDEDVEEDAFHQGLRKHKRFCKRQEVQGIVWPKTRYGRIVERDCPKPLIGVSSWVCLSRGWDRKGPDYSQCTHQWVVSFNSQMEDVMEGKEDADRAAESLSDVVEGKEMSAGDLSQTATLLLPKLVRGMQAEHRAENKMQRRRRLKKFKKSFIKTSSTLLAPKQGRAWRKLSKKQCRAAATSLMKMVENTGYQTAAVMDTGASDITINDNIIMKVNALSYQQTLQDIEFPSKSGLYRTTSNWKDLADSIVIPSSNLKRASRGGRVNVVFTIYKNMAELVQPEGNGASSNSDNDDVANTIVDGNEANNGDTNTEDKVIINSHIISASINSDTSHRQLSEPISFTLHHLQPTEEATSLCSFWEMNESMSGGSWSQKGCRVVDTNATHTTCECNHLTNFAVLMDVSGEELAENHELALRVITYIGCIVSIVCLMLSWITFMVFKNLQCDRITIHKNLVLCLMIAEIIFLAGIAQTQPKLLCSIIAGLLHYFFLAAFAWMCLEGVQLYVMLVEVFELEKSRVKWYYLFGYGLPLVIVGVSAGIKYEGYGTGKHCWLNNDNYFIWSFIGPALTVIMINLGMLSIAICTMCRHSNVSATMKERSKINKFKAWVKGAVVLVVLLGLTWILGVFYLNQESLVMAYAFTILNSLQGLFIFVFHCLMNEKVQKEYRKIARRTSWLPNCIRVNYGGYTGVSSSPNQSTGSGNYFSRLFGPRRRKQSAISTNSSMKPFLNKDQYRRSSTLENSSSRDSSTIPSSLNGYVYTPHYTTNNNHTHHPVIPYNNNGVLLKQGYNGYPPLEPCYETVGEAIAGELSEFIDCSVIDSEMVTEYCQNNMQVCQEQRRYSTGSENSGYEVPREVIGLSRPTDPDGISTLSCSSSMKKPASSFVSNSDIANRSDLDVSETEEGVEDEDEKSLDLHLEQYIIPTKPKEESGLPSSDQKSSSMNKIAKPSASFKNTVPDGGDTTTPAPTTSTSLHHSSSPNIDFKPGYSTQTSSPVPSSTPQTHTTTNHRHSDVPKSEAANFLSSSTTPSLAGQPNGGIPHQPPREESHYKVPPKARPASEADLPFSPFKFSQSNC